MWATAQGTIYVDAHKYFHIECSPLYPPAQPHPTPIAQTEGPLGEGLACGVLLTRERTTSGENHCRVSIWCYICVLIFIFILKKNPYGDTFLENQGGSIEAFCFSCLACPAKLNRLTSCISVFDQSPCLSVFVILYCLQLCD